MRKFLAILALTSLAACATATEKVNSDVSAAGLKRSTATYFSTAPRNVQVGSLRQSMLGTSYKAKVSGRMYDCKYFRTSVTCQHAR
ncbi:hypothetical protein EF888_13620 [Silicimonas algicola]|uniref:Lipoprotein n=1 Tax=Silicimonas algicola TaxID=1826607 RepID=A0A316GB76_9RHOB|nr:hypothetical protein [Silicimonas algicola]AZQ68080.1 hypothetical protein EF888_13620 [Silicimonas algicola]PWK57465.1 hypothetical protein C8D95_102108 [Silicimonas algicola]